MEQAENKNNQQEPETIENDNPKLSAEEEKSLLAFLNKVEEAAKKDDSVDPILVDQINIWKREITPKTE